MACTESEKRKIQKRIISALLSLSLTALPAIYPTVTKSLTSYPVAANQAKKTVRQIQDEAKNKCTDKSLKTDIAESKTVTVDEHTIEKFENNDVFYEPKKESICVVDDNLTAYANDSLAIFFSDDANENDRLKIIDSLGGEVVGHIDEMNEYEIKIGHSELEDLTVKCDELMKNEKVEFASLSILNADKKDNVPNDPWGDYTYWSDDALDYISYAFDNWWIKATEIDKAWDYKDYFHHINIGIVDSGFDTEHEDLQGKIAFPDGYFESESAPSNHGTHVAGIIGATHDNDLGISGVVDNCTMICADWSADKEQGQHWNNSARVMTGFLNVVKAGAKVVNFSLGSSGTIRTGNDRLKIVKDAEAKYTSYFVAKLLQGGYDFICCQSAGNGVNKNDGLVSYAVDASNNGHFCTITEENAIKTVPGVTPKDIVDRIIVVASAKFNGYGSFEQSSFSNGGNNVSICAPGSFIYSTYYYDENDFKKYKYLSGTSMACPIVTGIASLVWSVNPSFTGAQVKHFVCDEENTSIEVADSSDDSHLPTGSMKMVNARMAVEAAIKATETNGIVKGNIKWARETADNYVTATITEISNNTNYRIHTDEFGDFTESLPSGRYILTVEGSPRFSKEFEIFAPIPHENAAENEGIENAEDKESKEIVTEIQITDLCEIVLNDHSVDNNSFLYRRMNDSRKFLSAIGLY